MGKIMSLMMRPVKKFNIENRAHKVISREKPAPAPLYESSKKQLDIARSVNPSFLEMESKKDAKLDDRLKSIYVQSHDIKPVTEIQEDPNRPLPVLTKNTKDFDYGFWEPENVTQGRCTLRLALEFMSEHQANPITHSAQEIAAKYKLDLKDVENTLRYFRVFQVIVPGGEPALPYTERTKLQSGE